MLRICELLIGWMLFVTLCTANLAADEVKSLADEPAAARLSPEEMNRCREEAWKGVESLKSGYFRFTGTMEAGARGVLTLSGQQVFDYDKQQLRFDYVVKPKKDPLIEQLQYISRPDWSATFVAGDRSFICLHAPRRTAGMTLMPFDPRVLGLTDYDAQRRDAWPDGIRLLLLDKEPVQADRMSEGLYRLAWHWSDEFGTNSRQTVWFNPEQGFSPVRRESWTTVEGIHTLRYVIQASYVRLNDCWLPARWQVTDQNEPHNRLAIDMELDWVSCNQADFKRMYEVEGLGAPAGTKVVDFRVKPPVEVFRIEVPR